MSMKDSVAAHHQAGFCADYHWWDKKAAVKGLKSLLKQLEDSPDDARLCCRPGLKEDGSATLWLYVTHEGEATRSHDNDPMDQSHPCPPFCP